MSKTSAFLFLGRGVQVSCHGGRVKNLGAFLMSSAHYKRRGKCGVLIFV